MEIMYRVGEKRDSVAIATGIDQASGGIMDFLFQGLMQNSVQSVAYLLEQEVGNDSYQNAFITECQGEIIGIVYSYPAKFHGISEEMRTLFPAKRLELVSDFFNSKVENSLLLDSIFVDERFRGNGVGTRLIELTKERAKKLGYPEVSLMVMADNETARKVYQKNGFKVIKHVQLPEHRLIPHAGGVYLMASNV